MGVGQEDHDALLQEVRRLEAELGRIKDDLQGVMGCRGRCEQLDSLKDTVRKKHTHTECSSHVVRHFYQHTACLKITGDAQFDLSIAILADNDFIFANCFTAHKKIYFFNIEI